MNSVQLLRETEPKSAMRILMIACSHGPHQLLEMLKRIQVFTAIDQLGVTAEQRTELRSLVISSIMQIRREIPNLTDSWNSILSFREASPNRAIASWRDSRTEGVAYGLDEVTFLFDNARNSLS